MSERFETIDLVRGWALLGVAIINVHAMARGWTNHYALDLADTWYDTLAEYVLGIFFAHRAFPSLAFLLGVGIALQWRALNADGALVPGAALRVLRCRYAALLLLGVGHGLLLWPGDIVSSYALIVLVLLWRWPKDSNGLLRWVRLLGALVILVYALAVFGIATTAAQELPLSFPSFAYSPWSLALRMHLTEYFSYGLIQSALPEVWFAIALGVMIGQSGALERWLRGEANARMWFAFGFASFAIGTALELASSRLGAWDFTYPDGLGGALFTLGLPLASVGSVFVLLALARAWPTARARAVRETLIAAGKAPLTMFFGMSMGLIPIFHASFADWHAEMGRAAYTAVAVVMYALLAKFVSAWFAAGHARGPVELAWMRLAEALSSRGGSIRDAPGA